MTSKQLMLDLLSGRSKHGRKSFAVLIDPDKVADEASLLKLIHLSVQHGVDFFFVGGSLITDDSLDWVISLLREESTLPVVLFPGSNLHIHQQAHAILFLSLISGRNPEFLIGQQVVAAPILKKSKLEVIPTGYMLVGSGLQTTAAYISNTLPIPNDKPSIAACTAMAGEMLGLRVLYMDAGSGALEPISPRVIGVVRRSVEVPLIVGGGIRSGNAAKQALQAGADVVVIGNGIEKNLNLLIEVSGIVKELNGALNIHE
ncbi:geranylgeranylglyceryl/heptaprenylglyceryl phosphate synthase [Cesiribacter andamanensis]|uniref:Geranylgeranylglyceryl phosphate synthase n=1 Tax=Cesiribacter andamanensis AMV16 TaxID=1279009 RepID=M7NZR6_9BACT|nr:geranylgeranylglyceryl/heptaprenylglyceryl phosphate synthase [Cesiribacter andamanensis]EMR03844.1 geranylgeranylglyceryl phosphate synthase-like protein [Cesiribacter andamanensis AMV16]